MVEREHMDYDVVIIGGGPAGLSAAIRLRQLAVENNTEITVCVLEKGSEVGAHIVSGAIVETRALDELIPDWKEKGAPLTTPVTSDEVYLLRNEESSVRIPNVFVPKPMHNKGNYITSLGNLTRWLGEQAEALETEIFPGFPAAKLLFKDDAVAGVITSDMGVAKNGENKEGYEPGMELRAKYTIFAEGCRGHLGKQVIEKYDLEKDATPQHYGLGIKELWDVDADKLEPGKVVHGTGWPLTESGSSGGFFLYHLEGGQVSVGLITDLNYSNPFVSPFEEFQRLKHHPEVKKYLDGGRRVSYGARAITKGGLNSLPKMTFPGGLVVGCDAGTLNFAKIKGTHTAMKTGMLAAESIFEALQSGCEGYKELSSYTTNFENSWVYEELHNSRNFGPALHKWGTYLGGAFNYLDQNWFGGKIPVTLKDMAKDHEQFALAADSKKIDYPKPDNKLSFDRLSSVYLSSTDHEEDQPCHLTLKDAAVPIVTNLKLYDAPEQRYCPAGVYEIIEVESKPMLQINAQNCVHCKTCDIKDPTQNIVWEAPEGTGGPNYANM